MIVLAEFKDVYRHQAEIRTWNAAIEIKYKAGDVLESRIVVS